MTNQPNLPGADNMTTRNDILNQQVEQLTALHSKPVAVCLQSGGGVAYATFIVDGHTLFGYDLSTVWEPTLEYELPLTLLANGYGRDYVFEWLDRADTLPIDPSADLVTYWDSEGEYSPNEYRYGTYYALNTGTGLTVTYGVGGSL